MRNICISVIIVLFAHLSFAQLQPTISVMKWASDYKLHVKLANDSAYVVDVKGLHHTGGNLFDTTDRSTTYYPVSLDKEFVNYIKSKNLMEEDAVRSDTVKTSTKTLWSAVHSEIGGSYVHFVNCLVYMLESQPLALTSPIFKRPTTGWKPKPMTQSYKRTRKWEFYYPSTQKQAKKEYKLRLKENDLSDLHGVPSRFIDLFMSTSQGEYEKMQSDGKVNQVAQIDLVRLLLGAKYLGEAQIRSITSYVKTAILRYNVNTMPSIIIFDDYKAAVAMTLERDGYKINRIVYSDSETASRNELEGRTEMIEQLIKTINRANEQVFQKRLRMYYQRKRW